MCRLHTHTHIQTNTHIDIFTHTHTNTQGHTRTHTHTHTHTHIETHTHRDAYRHTDTATTTISTTIAIVYSYRACVTCKKALVKEMLGGVSMDKCPRCERIVSEEDIFTDFIMDLVVFAGEYLFFNVPRSEC